MRWVFLLCGAVATAAMIAVSMRLNFLFGAALGQTPERSLVFGLVSVGADAWKGLGPIFILALWRSRRPAPAAAATIMWVPCFLFSVSSALGLAIQDRTAAIGGREAAQATYEQLRGELRDTEAKRRGLPPHRSIGQIEAAIEGHLNRAVSVRQRVRGTVNRISAGCTRADARTAEACSEVARLRQELAVAVEGHRLDGDIKKLRERVVALRDRGAGEASDPQAQLLSRLTRGWIAVRDVAPGLALLLAAVIEVVSAFGPVVVAAYAESTRSGTRQEGAKLAPGLVVAGRGVSRQAAARRDDHVIEYMAERIAPAGDTHAIGGDEIFADYVSWCGSRKCPALAFNEFLAEFDRKRREHDLEGKIRKFGNRYFGIRLSSLLLTS